MIALGVLGGWAGYAIATYGYLLVKGWDIPWSAWVSPVSPYTWPKPPGKPPLIPADQLFPSSASAPPGGETTNAAPARKARPPAAGGGGTSRPHR